MKDILPAKVVTRERKKCMFRVWNMHFSSALYQIICTNFYHALLIFLHSEE